VKSIRAAIVYHFLAHYREPIFRLLCSGEERPVEYFVFASDQADDPSLPGVKALRHDPTTAPELVARERYLRGLIRAQAMYQMDLSISGKDPAEKDEVTHQVNRLRAEYQEIEAQLKDHNPRFPGLNPSAPLSLGQVQDQLRDGNTILLEYALGEAFTPEVEAAWSNVYATLASAMQSGAGTAVGADAVLAGTI